MSDTRDEKRDKFVECKKSDLKIKPMYILGLVAVIVGIVVAATLLASNSGEETEIVFQEPDTNINGTISDKAEVGNLAETNATDATVTQNPLPAFSVANFEIKGMTCGGCSSGIMKGLADAEGVSKSNISYRDKAGIVEYDSATTNPQKIADYITSMGFATTVVE